MYKGFISLYFLNFCFGLYCFQYTPKELAFLSCLQCDQSIAYTQFCESEDYQYCKGLQNYNKSECDLKKSPIGSQCTKDFQCQTNFCVNEECHPIKQEKCSNHLDCEIGYFCDSQSLECEKQRLEGQSCQFPPDCQNNLTCDGNVCVPFLSLKNGENCQKIQRSTLTTVC